MKDHCSSTAYTLKVQIWDKSINFLWNVQFCLVVTLGLGRPRKTFSLISILVIISIKSISLKNKFNLIYIISSLILATLLYCWLTLKEWYLGISAIFNHTWHVILKTASQLLGTWNDNRKKFYNLNNWSTKGVRECFFFFIHPILTRLKGFSPKREQRLWKLFYNIFKFSKL